MMQRYENLFIIIVMGTLVFITLWMVSKMIPIFERLLQ